MNKNKPEASAAKHVGRQLHAYSGEDVLRMLKSGGSFADLEPLPLPAEFREWRVFLKGRPLTTVIVASAEDAIEQAAAAYAVSRESLTALDEDFVTWYEKSLERKQKPRLRAACHHEAGHAVVARYLGGTVTSLSTIPRMTHTGDIVGDIDSMGRMGWATPDDQPQWRPGSARAAEGKALVLLAGLASEFRLTGKARWRARAWEGDIQRARAIARERCGSDSPAVAALLETWKGEAAALAGQLWGHITAVANALWQERELRGAQLDELLRSVPTAEDGSPD